MIRTCRLLLLCSAVTALAAAPVVAQEMDEAAMMKAWQEAMTPGAVHEYLASFVGTWNVTSKMYMDPSQPPMESTGKSTKSMILGGRFLREDMEATMMGMPMTGLGLTGYNNTTGMMEFTWMDNMGTMMMTGSGKKDGDTMTLVSTYMDPMSKAEATTTMVTEVLGKDEYTFKMYNKMDGKDVLMMEAHYTRAK